MPKLDIGVDSNLYLTAMIDQVTKGTRELLRIGEVALRGHVRTDTLRYYERLGLVEPATRSPGGYRLYDPEAVERLAFVKKAQAMGLTLEEVREVIKAALEGSPPCDHVRATLRTRLGEVDQRIADLRALRGTLVRALERSRDVPVADGCLCAIIESQELASDRPVTSGARRARS